MSAFLLSLILAAPSQADGREFAIVVGYNVSDRPGVEPLKYADDDAIAMHRLLSDAGFESTLLVAPDAATSRLYPGLVADGGPGVGALRTAIARVNERIGEARDASLLLFISGHGEIEGDEGYVSLADGRLTRSILLGEILQGVKARRRHVIIDACKSYFLAFDKGAGGEQVAYTRSFVEKHDASQLADTGFILSTSSSNQSHEWERYQAGVFSYEVLSGLRGAADADANGRVTYAELGAFIATANHAIPNERYRPDFLVYPPKGQGFAAPLVAWSGADTLEIDRAALGHFYLENELGVRLLDVHPATPGFVIHLPDKRPLYLRDAAERFEMPIPKGKHSVASRLARRPVSTASKGALSSALEKLFSEPFRALAVPAFVQEQVNAPTIHRTADQPPAWLGTARRAALITAIVGATIGVGAFAWGENRSRAVSADTSQREHQVINRDLRLANMGMVGGGVTAAAAGGLWLTLQLAWDDP
jgi:hypothetical protein